MVPGVDIIGPVVGSATPAGAPNPEVDCGEGDKGPALLVPFFPNASKVATCPFPGSQRLRSPSLSDLHTDHRP